MCVVISVWNSFASKFWFFFYVFLFFGLQRFDETEKSMFNFKSADERKKDKEKDSILKKLKPLLASTPTDDD